MSKHIVNSLLEFAEEMESIGHECEFLEEAATEIMRLRVQVSALEVERDQLAAELATLRSPNLVWDSTNPEDSSVDSIEDAVYQYIDWFGDAKVGDELTFFVARKLPNVTVRITSVNEDGEVTFDVVNTALAAEGENSDV